MELRQLDEVDRRLLELLMENSRLSNAELGRQVNLSRAAVRERINSLVERGVIQRFTVVVNPLKAGKTVSAFFDIEVEPQSLYKVAGVLAADPNITNIYQMTGPSLLHVHALLDDHAHLERFIRDVLYACSGIRRVESQLLLTRFKERESTLV